MIETCAGYLFLVALAALFAHLWWKKRDECKRLKKQLGAPLGRIVIKGKGED